MLEFFKTPFWKRFYNRYSIRIKIIGLVYVQAWKVTKKILQLEKSSLIFEIVMKTAEKVTQSCFAMYSQCEFRIE